MPLRFTLLAVLAIGACSREDPAAELRRTNAATIPSAKTPAVPTLPGLIHRELDAQPGSETPNFGVGRDGKVVLSWTEPADDGLHAVRIATRGSTGWSDGETIVRSDRLFINWADFAAAMPAAGGTLVAAWLENAAEGKGYGVQWARSADHGRTWSTAAPLHDHAGGPEYGFVSFAHGPGQSTTVYWLDGRDAKGHGEGQMQLRSAAVSPEGTVGQRRQVDPRVCDCCQTSAAATSKGTVVVYRDRSDEEVRDIMIAGPGTTSPRPVAADGWTIDGCPVNGPAVASRGDALAVAWFSGKGEQPRVRVAFGSASGAFVAADVEAGEAVIGRVDVEWLGDDAVALSYLRRRESGEADVVVRRVPRSGDAGTPYLIGTTDAGTRSGFPRMARSGEQLLWAWTHVEGGTARIRVAEASVTAFGAPSSIKSTSPPTL